MYLFIWEYVDNLTDREHSGGGLVIIGENLEDARKCLEKKVPQDCEAYTKVPDLVKELVDSPLKAMTYIFPDAGCC